MACAGIALRRGFLQGVRFGRLQQVAEYHKGCFLRQRQFRRDVGDARNGRQAGGQHKLRVEPGGREHGVQQNRLVGGMSIVCPPQ